MQFYRITVLFCDRITALPSNRKSVLVYSLLTINLFDCTFLSPCLRQIVLPFDYMTDGKDLTTQATKDTQNIIEETLGRWVACFISLDLFSFFLSLPLTWSLFDHLHFICTHFDHLSCTHRHINALTASLFRLNYLFSSAVLYYAVLHCALLYSTVMC